MRTYDAVRASALLVYLKCPTTGRTIDAIRGDDKVICNCPAALQRGGTHLVSQCQASTVEKYMVERGYISKAESIPRHGDEEGE